MKRCDADVGTINEHQIHGFERENRELGAKQDRAADIILCNKFYEFLSSVTDR